MAVQETTQGADAKDARIKELTEENELLFEQLHVVQEELENTTTNSRSASSAKAAVRAMMVPLRSSRPRPMKP